MAWRGLFVVVEVVVPDEFFPGNDIPHGKDPYAALDLVDLTIGIARVIQVRTQAVSVDHGLSILKPVKVGARYSFVAAVGLVRSDALAVILDDPRSFADRGGGVDADGVYG